MQRIFVVKLNQLQIEDLNRSRIFEPLRKDEFIDGDQIVDETNWSFFKELKCPIYIPASLIEKSTEETNVYLELEQYAFFKRFKEFIVLSKGVMRFRRFDRGKGNQRLMASDLVSFSQIFGEPIHLHMIQTKGEVSPTHVIIAAKFQGGVMAHFEYTFHALEERIEMEWSGIKQIIEFDSKEMTPIEPKELTCSPLTISIKQIVQTAVPSEEFIPEFNKIFSFLSRGEEK